MEELEHKVGLRVEESKNKIINALQLLALILQSVVCGVIKIGFNM